MEGGGSEGEKKKSPEGEIKSKRKMKTASQLQILEDTYAVEAYPSEAVRAELSAKLGLSDRQLQMWFCHRRLKDRKAPPAKRPRNDFPAAASASAVVPLAGGNVEEMAAGEVGNEHVSGLGSFSSQFAHAVDSRRLVPRTGHAVVRVGGDLPAMKRYYEPPQSIAELRAIAFVEAQLEEPLREDGPILGMEFDPLPPDAFGAPIGAAIVGQQKQTVRQFEINAYEEPDAKSNKVHPQGSAGALHEYQFLPEQPTVRSDTYERVAPTYHYGSPAEGFNARTSSSIGRSFIHGNEQGPSGYGFQGQMPVNLLYHQGRQDHLFQSTSGEHDTVPRKNSFTNIAVDAQLSSHPINALENPFILSDKIITPDEDVSRVERKRKSEEARIAREVEAHEKRIRKELEKQDILRRKREEQVRKEMERHDRERRKEEERLLREKQREEERYQREQRRELERREKFLQKEFIRAEKMRQKEEQRREKEAARLKAANERAIARKVAKESIELIEDEHLELMELAASSKGLPSILSLDFDTLQNLELFRDKLTIFPPKTAKLKMPFAIQPWIGREENIGNLLMVWRFLITFADILGLWPFTLDEFVQAFHDYDPRLLGEIHIALLRSIIKDIEDVARAPATGLGSNQNSAANHGGGHPLIVEGAYAWGFDIRSWQRSLNPLTWPEILRQFALSAGFGPQLKKRNIEQSYLHDDSEGNDCEDIISNLRNGAAAVNAVAVMQERGFGNPRKSRHRLTPGTVKFAAFHVLSIEGSMGLTILEVAEKIQKSGLRDLTTSKTPEASIAAALSRDSKLFERTAPSTYCVRDAYRKDPADAEVILSAARERIRIFKSGILDGEEANDAERDEDSESDAAEDPEVDDFGNELNTKEVAQRSQEVNRFNEKPLADGEESLEIMETPQGGPVNVSEGLSLKHSEGLTEVINTNTSINQSLGVTGIFNEVANTDQEGADIDENNPGEPWVQGLMEGEYADLSVEERLNALVALIGVAIEGNSIHFILEERLEVANALKKQIWAEAQLDKRRTKEEFVMKMHYSSYMGNKTESNCPVSAEGRQSPLLSAEEKNNGISVDRASQQERLIDPQNDNNYLNNFPTERNPQMQDYSAGPDNLPIQPPGLASEKSRSQLKSYIGHKAEEMYVYRSLPLGQDRRRNRYWQFTTSASRNDPGCGRIFVELHDGRWRLIESEEGFDAILASLDVRGVRESHLFSMLQKIEMLFKESVRTNMLRASAGWKSRDSVQTEAVEMALGSDCSVGADSPRSSVCIADFDVSETSTSFAIERGRNETEKTSALQRYLDFEKWMWNECFNSSILCAMKSGKKWNMQLLGVCDHCHDVYCCEDNHCLSCHRTYSTFNSNRKFSEHVAQCEEKQEMDSNCTLPSSACSPLRIILLKLQLALIEVSIPPEALQAAWTDGYRKSWGMKLHSSLSAEDLLRILTLFEGAIKRNYLSSNFETTKELLGSSELSESVANHISSPETVAVLPWVPQTTAAVALRLTELDASISYMLHQKVETQKDNGSGDYIKLPSRYAVVKNTHDHETAVTPYRSEQPHDENWVNIGIGVMSSGRGRGGRGRRLGSTRGGRSQRKAIGSRSGSSKRSTVTTSKRPGLLGWKGRTGGRGGRRRGGRQSIRNKQKAVKSMADIAGKRETPREIFTNSERDLVGEEWNGDETIRLQMDERSVDASSSERSEYDVEIGQASGDDFDDLAMDDYGNGFNHKSDNLLEGSDYIVDGDEDDDDNEELGDDGDQGDLDIEDINGDSDEERHGNGVGGLNQDPDEVTASTSSDYSE